MGQKAPETADYAALRGFYRAKTPFRHMSRVGVFTALRNISNNAATQEQLNIVYGAQIYGSEQEPGLVQRMSL